MTISLNCTNIILWCNNIIDFIVNNTIIYNLLVVLSIIFLTPLCVKLSWSFVKLVKLYIAKLFNINLNEKEETNFLLTIISVSLIVIALAFLIPCPD